MMNGTSLLTRAGLSALALVAFASASQAQASSQDQVAAIKTAMGENAAAQRKYVWVETSEVAYKGDVKSTTTSSCQYLAGANQPKCTQTSAPPEEKKQRGVVRRSIKDSKVEGMKEYMDSVKTLVGEYVPTKQELISAAQGRGDVAVATNPSDGTMKLTISNYLQKGDAVIITVNEATHQVAHVAVNTWLNDPGATVTLDVSFTTIASGVSFASKKVLTASAKEIAVTISDANFALAAQ